MADYTVELRKIVESGIPVFDFNYPFYDETKRKDFETRFIKHFYFREIGCETVERFKWYLEDKMNVVFPYYNMLMETATIDYDIMDNYRLKETYTRNVERNDATSGISSTVGRTFGNQETETNQNRVVDTTENADTVGKDTIEKTETVDNDTTTNSTTDTTNSKNASVDASGTQKDIKKFLDTPQGLVDIDDVNYVTNVNNDTSTKSEQSTTNETDTGKQTTTGSGTNDTTTDSLTETNTTLNQERTGKENLVDDIKGTSKQEQHSTADNNTRTYSKGDTKEEYTIERRGNIGIDTDSDGIQKHIKLQKVLTEIEKMFFDECEDLFMLVY